MRVPREGYLSLWAGYHGYWHQPGLSLCHFIDIHWSPSHMCPGCFCRSTQPSSTADRLAHPMCVRMSGSLLPAYLSLSLALLCHIRD